MSIQTFGSHPSSPRGILPFERIMDEYYWGCSLPTMAGALCRPYAPGGTPWIVSFLMFFVPLRQIAYAEVMAYSICN